MSNRDLRMFLADAENKLSPSGFESGRVSRIEVRAVKEPIAVSEAMQRVLAIADKVAATPSSSALLIGESGVGKELIARRIHERSRRRDRPLVCINLAAVPEPMVEAELFGSVKGAFTDAKRDRPGLFATAEGGTILLDELGEFRPELQAKLLRVLEERRFFPVGSDHERQIDVRVLAATNKDPELLMQSGELRQDLYYRLATVVIRVPPLRERPEDILPLVDHFVSVFSAEFEREPCEVTPEARRMLAERAWPGNVRELRNVVERAVMMAETHELGSSLFESPPPSSSHMPAAKSTDPMTLEHAKAKALEDVERAHIERVLKMAQGSKVRAAEMLGVSRTTLWEKLRRYGLA